MGTPRDPLAALAADLALQADAARDRLPVERAAASLLRRARKSLVDELSTGIARGLEDGSLASHWAASVADAEKHLPHEEVELGALAAMLHELVLRAGRVVDAQATELDDSVKAGLGRVMALDEVNARLAPLAHPTDDAPRA